MGKDYLPFGMAIFSAGCTEITALSCRTSTLGGPKSGGSRRTAFLRVATAALTGRHFCGNAFDGILFLGLDLLDEVATSMGLPAVA